MQVYCRHKKAEAFFLQGKQRFMLHEVGLSSSGKCCNTAALWLYLLQPQLLLSWSGGEVGAARTFREQGEGSIVLFSVSRLEIAHTYILYTQAAVGRLWRGERKDASNDSM
jgi:hypothetical protein